jgi:hypothetical protein
MKRSICFSRFAAIMLLGCGLIVLGGAAYAADKAQLSGTWNYNADQSDNAQLKVQQAQQTSQSAGSNTPGARYPGGGGGYPGSGGNPGGMGYPSGGGYPGGTGYPGGGGYPSGGSGNGSGPRGMQTPGSVSPQQWSQLAANPKYLAITQQENQIVISDDSHTLTLDPDGKKHSGKDEDGNKTSIRTQWQGDELVTETRMGSGKLTNTYQRSSDGKQLIVTSRFEDFSLAGNLSIRRVYDLANTAQ